MPEAPAGVLTPDETLVRLARQGCRSSLEELFRRHWSVSYRVAYRMLGHEHDALDAVQEGLTKAVAHWQDFDGRSGFRTWLLRIVTNAAIDSARKRKRRPSVSLTVLHEGEANGREPATEDDPATALHRQDLRQTLDAALDRLSTTTRTTFVLFAEAGLSYKEIAEVQNIPIGTVMSRIFDARHKLQRLLNWEQIEGI